MQAFDLKLSYRLDPADWREGQARIMRQGPWGTVVLALGIWMVAGLVGSFHAMRKGFSWGAVEIGFVGLFGLIGLILAGALLFHFFSRFLARRRLMQAPGGPFVATMLDVTNDGVMLETGTGQVWREWRAFEAVEVTDRLILLYTSPVEAIMIPRRVLGSDEAMLAFVHRARDLMVMAGG